MTKTRTYVFTLNNYSDEHLRRIEEHWHKHFTYLCYGEEIAPTTGTPHLQGTLRCPSARAPSGIRRALAELLGADARPHIEAAKGTFEQAVAYCRKDGRFTEFGDPPRQGRGIPHKTFLAMLQLQFFEDF